MSRETDPWIAPDFLMLAVELLGRVTPLSDCSTEFPCTAHAEHQTVEGSCPVAASKAFLRARHIVEDTSDA